MKSQSAEAKWKNDYAWLSKFTTDTKRPVLSAICVRDGRAYATDGIILVSIPCPEQVPNETMLSPKGKDSALLVGAGGYPDVTQIIPRNYGDQLRLRTDTLIETLTTIASLFIKDDQPEALAVYDRDDKVLRLFAENKRGASVSAIIGADNHSPLYQNERAGSGCYFNPLLWLKVIKGWQEKPDMLIEFAVRRGKEWQAALAKLSPVGEADKPFGLVMSLSLAHRHNHPVGAYAALSEASRLEARSDYASESYKPYRTSFSSIKSLDDLPMFEGVGKFKLGSGVSLPHWSAMRINLEHDQARRVDHFDRMKRYLVGHGYPEHFVAAGKDIEPYIRAIKESQNER